MSKIYITLENKSGDEIDVHFKSKGNRFLFISCMELLADVGLEELEKTTKKLKLSKKQMIMITDLMKEEW